MRCTALTRKALRPPGRQLFPNHKTGQRPVSFRGARWLEDDIWRHAREENETPRAKNGKCELANPGWTVAALKSLRRIPTLDCARMLHEGFSARLAHEFDEPETASYLGPNNRGPQKYAIRATARARKEEYHVRRYNEDAWTDMLFCPNWAGLGALTSGREGSSVEPIHSPREKARQDVAVLAAGHSSMEILQQMQYLHDNCSGNFPRGTKLQGTHGGRVRPLRVPRI